MDFTLSSREAMFHRRVRSFIHSEVRPSLDDDAIQAHGGGGVSDDFALAADWASIRTLRFADGPDEVHARAIARSELSRDRDQLP